MRPAMRVTPSTGDEIRLSDYSLLQNTPNCPLCGCAVSVIGLPGNDM
jgi:hypothetical protein